MDVRDYLSNESNVNELNLYVENGFLNTMKRIKVVTIFVGMECPRLCIERQLLHKTRPSFL